MLWWEQDRLRVLVADEDEAARDAARGLMPPETSLVVCTNGAEALWFAGQGQPGVVILSATLPLVPAAAVARVLAEHRAVRQTVVVGAGFGELDRAGPVLEAGASAVVSRPYERRELRPVLDTHLDDLHRRRRDAAVIELGPLRLHGPAFEASAGGRRLRLSLRQFELLRLLMVHGDEVVSRERIQEAIWAVKGGTVSGNTVAVHVRRLRSHLVGSADITAVRGVGYRLRVREKDTCRCRATSEEQR